MFSIHVTSMLSCFIFYQLSSLTIFHVQFCDASYCVLSEILSPYSKIFSDRSTRKNNIGNVISYLLYPPGFFCQIISYNYVILLHNACLFYTNYYCHFWRRNKVLVHFIFVRWVLQDIGLLFYIWFRHWYQKQFFSDK